TEAIIERAWQVAPSVQRLELSTNFTDIKAGQSLLVLGEGYLREQWIPIEVNKEVLTVERPASQHYPPGQIVNLLGPVGNALPWISGNRRLLLIAHDTPPTPLLMLAGQAVKAGASVAMVLLGDAANYPFAGIPAAVEVLVGNTDGTWADRDETILW